MIVDEDKVCSTQMVALCPKCKGKFILGMDGCKQCNGEGKILVSVYEDNLHDWAKYSKHWIRNPISLIKEILGGW